MFLSPFYCKIVDNPTQKKNGKNLRNSGENVIKLNMIQEAKQAYKLVDRPKSEILLHFIRGLHLNVLFPRTPFLPCPHLN